MRIFDAHCHIIDPRYPLVSNQGFLPDFFDTSDYLRRVSALGVSGGAVVSGSFQAFDQTYLVNALRELGGTYVGVAQVPFEISDGALADLNHCGVRAVRFNLKRGGESDLREIDRLANRVFSLFGWHAEFYLDADSLSLISDQLTRLPRVVIDHLGLESAASKGLLGLVDKGAMVKATGFGRLDFDPVGLMAQIHALNPGALMFGTDLPSTRAPRPFEEADLVHIQARFDQPALDRILWQNAFDLYKPPAGN